MRLGVAMMLLGLGGLAAVAYGCIAGERGGLKPLFYLSLTVAVIGFAFVNPSVVGAGVEAGRPAAAGRSARREPVVRGAGPHPRAVRRQLRLLPARLAGAAVRGRRRGRCSASSVLLPMVKARAAERRQREDTG